MSLSADDVMTSAQVAKLLNETVKNVETWARAEVLPGFKLGRRWKFFRSDIEEVLRDARRRRRRSDS